jgi:hypothetical protein
MFIALRKADHSTRRGRTNNEGHRQEPETVPMFIALRNADHSTPKGSHNNEDHRQEPEGVPMFIEKETHCMRPLPGRITPSFCLL